MMEPLRVEEGRVLKSIKNPHIRALKIPHPLLD